VQQAWSSGACCRAVACSELWSLLQRKLRARSELRSKLRSLLQRKLRAWSSGACWSAVASALQQASKLVATQAPSLELRSLLPRCNKLRGLSQRKLGARSSEACCRAATSSKLLSFSRACLLGFSLLAKKKPLFFFFG